MKIKKILTISTLCSGLIIAGSAFADDHGDDEAKAPGSGPNPFTDCGIGAALFPNSNVGAVTSNVIWDAGTTAVTSATASPETCSGKNVAAAEFILETYDSLAEETAKGSGEHLATLLDLLETTPESRDQIIADIRSKVAGVVASDSYAEKSQVQKASDYYAIVSQSAAKHSS